MFFIDWLNWFQSLKFIDSRIVLQKNCNLYIPSRRCVFTGFLAYFSRSSANVFITYIPYHILNKLSGCSRVLMSVFTAFINIFFNQNLNITIFNLNGHNRDIKITVLSQLRPGAVKIEWSPLYWCLVPW